MVGTIQSAELAELLATSAVDLIDVRNPDEWDTGHIPGARLVPLHVFRNDPDAVLKHGTTIVFACAKGVRSMQAAKLAERFGYESVLNLEGGTKEWARTHELAFEANRAAA
ncbi:MAG: rhodanese-like domain-containing protein [Kofleriaceae bacterium]